MAHLIDKDALEEKIEKRIAALKVECDRSRRPQFTLFGKVAGLESCLSIINILEVKEVDLDFQHFAKEMDAIFALPSSETKNTEENPLNWEYAIAKHFFELGLKANNPITSADRGTAEEIIINLKKIESDYNVCLTKEIEWVRKQVGQPELKTKQG